MLILTGLPSRQFFLRPLDLRPAPPLLGPPLFLPQFPSLSFQLSSLALQLFSLRQTFPFFLAEPPASSLPIIPLEAGIRMAIVRVIIPIAIVVRVVVRVASPRTVIRLVIPNRGAACKNQKTGGNEQPKGQSLDTHVRSPFFRISL
jgi:hypothetical protein